LREESKTIEVEVRPRRGSKPICSGCYRPGRGYDRLSERRFEFIPVWGYVRAIGVDEIQYGRGHQYLTPVYGIESSCTRLLWVGNERTARHICS